jgi:dolichol-phosphate mannosyltransferase
MCLAMIFVLYSLYARLFLQKSPQGFTALIVALTFLSGIVLFFLGVIGEYVGRIYEEIKARPHYIVGRKFGVSLNESSAKASISTVLEKELLR